MTRASRLVITAALVFVAVGPLLAQGRGPRPTITSLSGDVLEDWQSQKALIVNAANAMPEDKFTYKSTPAQRDFAAQVMHIVGANQMLLGTLGGKTPAPAINATATSKADVMMALRQVYDYGEAVVKEFSDAQLVERIAPPRFMGAQASRVSVIYRALSHTNDIYGRSPSTCASTASPRRPACARESKLDGGWWEADGRRWMV